MTVDDLANKKYKVLDTLDSSRKEYSDIFSIEAKIKTRVEIKRARIVKRNDNLKLDSDSDVIIGKDLNGLLKKGIIYEIIDYGLDQMIIRELGPSFDEEFLIPNQHSTTWNHDIGDIITMYMHRVLMTQKELEESNCFNNTENDNA